MIRINLLGLPKKGKRSAAPSGGGGGGASPLVIAVIVGGIALAANGGAYWYLNHQATVIKQKKAAADAENQRLQQVKIAYEKATKDEEALKRRQKAIDQLNAARSGPVELLNTVADTVNRTDAVWLSTMKEEGNNINLEGTALSARAVANLIANLRNTKHFKSVEIKETFQDDQVRDMQAFQFTLTCEKQAPKS